MNRDFQTEHLLESLVCKKNIIKLIFYLSNTTCSNITSIKEYTLSVKNDLGKVVYTQKRKPYCEGEKITVPGQERGYYILEVEAFVKDKKIAMVQGAFVSTPAMQKRDPFFRVNQFGIWTPLIDGYRMLGCGSATLPIIGREKGNPADNARKRFLGTYKRFLDSDFELHALYVGGVSQLNCDMDMFRRGYPMYSEV